MIKKLAILSSALGLLVAGGLQADVSTTYGSGQIAAATSNLAPSGAAGSSEELQLPPSPPFPGGPEAAGAAGSEAASSKAAGSNTVGTEPSGAAGVSTHPKKGSNAAH